jgi:NAD(P)-dependent dehydrogenase (short-subunit alcohol dehydrogenase family)
MSVAIITGVSRGLGLALAEGLTDVGWQVVGDARDTDALAAAVARVPGLHTVPGDVTDPAHRAALITEARRLGGIDLLVNSAGTLGPSPLPTIADYPLDGLRDVIEANLVAPLALLQLALPDLRERAGAIVNITSDAAVEPYPGWGGYGAGKAALEQVSSVLAAEEQALRVWWADPGDLRTRMHQDAFPGEDISDRPLPETVVGAFVHLVTNRPPSGRVRLAELPVPA